MSAIHVMLEGDEWTCKRRERLYTEWEHHRWGEVLIRVYSEGVWEYYAGEDIEPVRGVGRTDLEALLSSEAGGLE